MKRHWVIALAVLVAIPRLGHAQGDPGWGPVFTVTPFVGISPGIKQKGTALVTSGTTTTAHGYRIDSSSSVPLGIALEGRFWNRFSVIAEGAWAGRADAKLIDFEDEVVYSMDGSDYWLGKLALAMRLREADPSMQLRRLDASIFLGPAYIRDDPRVNSLTPALSSLTVSQWGLNMGANAEMPMSNKRLAFQLGLENFMVFWDNASYRYRVQGYVEQTNPSTSSVVLDAKKTNFWIMRGGLTFHF